MYHGYCEVGSHCSKGEENWWGGWKGKEKMKEADFVLYCLLRVLILARPVPVPMERPFQRRWGLWSDWQSSSICDGVEWKIPFYSIISLLGEGILTSVNVYFHHQMGVRLKLGHLIINQESIRKFKEGMGSFAFALTFSRYWFICLSHYFIAFWNEDCFSVILGCPSSCKTQWNKNKVILLPMRPQKSTGLLFLMLPLSRYHSVQLF